MRIAATRIGTTRDTNHRGHNVKPCARCGRERQVDKRRQVADMCRDCQLSDPNCFKEAA